MAEIIACPSCQRKLQVPDDYFGKTVQCPECKHTFTATPPGSVAPSPAAPPPPPVPPREEKVPEWEKRPAKAYDDDRPRRRDEDDDRPRRRDDDEDDEFDDVGRRRRRRYLAPHRGGMILVFGILSVLVCNLIFGPMAWVMGNNDLAEIRAGRMDPEGEGMTQAGRILGMIMTILSVASVLLFCVIALLSAAGNGRRF